MTAQQLDKVVLQRIASLACVETAGFLWANLQQGEGVTFMPRSDYEEMAVSEFHDSLRRLRKAGKIEMKFDGAVLADRVRLIPDAK